MAQDMVKKVDNTAAMMSRGTNYTVKQSRMQKDEKELAALLAEHTGETVEEAIEEVEETVEEVTKEPVESEEKEESDENLSREEKSFKKRYGDLRRHMADKEKEWKEQMELNTSAPLRAPSSDEDIEAWAEKYPDVAAIVETIASKKADEKFAVAEERLREYDEAAYEVERTRAEQLSVSHIQISMS